jgi:hypothetical protein
LTGAANGLEVELFVDQYSYMLQGLSRKGGARVVIHDSGSYPLVDQYGYDLEPGTSNSFGIEKVNLILSLKLETL